MLNLTVADLHTYYVLAGTIPVLVHNTGQCPAFAGISRQKQDRHVIGTDEYNRRIAAGTPTSGFVSQAEADAFSRYAWEHGTPVPGRPNLRDFEFGKPVGRGPNGGWQTAVRAHVDNDGRVHGHPKGREYP
jgi:hypothetical protein